MSGMIGILKKLAGMEPDSRCRGYSIMKYWHPDAKKPVERVGGVSTLEEAKEICTGEGSSYKEGDTSDWYFLGYVHNGSRTPHLTLWGQR